MEKFDESPWVSHRESTQHQAIRHGEDRGVRADAEGEGEDGDGGEAGRFAQHASQSASLEAGIRRKCVPWDFADFFLEFLIAAEFNARAALGFARSGRRTLEIARAILDVRAQLLFDLLLKPRPMEERRSEPTGATRTLSCFLRLRLEG